MDASHLSTPGVSKSRHGRKQLRMEQNWKKKKRKLGKDRGEAYITYKGDVKEDSAHYMHLCIQLSTKSNRN